jgi:hypothetical protein
MVCFETKNSTAHLTYQQSIEQLYDGTGPKGDLVPAIEYELHPSSHIKLLLIVG